MKLPSKKLTSYVLLIFIVAGLVYFFVYKSDVRTYSAPLSAEKSQESPILVKDADNDGLKDWEEQLWKTDMNIPDTDGDGTTDGQEIKQGRDPLLAGPNDKLDLETVSTKVNTETEGDLTSTDKFSRDLFLKIIAAKKANTPPTEADLTDYLNTSIKQEIEAQTLKEFTEGDITITSAENPEKIRAYGNMLAETLTKKPKKPLEHELVIVDRAQTKNDPAELEKLDPLYDEYKRIESELLAMTVPKSASATHLALVNAVTRLAWSIDGFKYFLTDQIKALPGISAYADNVQEFLTSVRRFNVYFKSENIEFTPEDRGYGFFDKI